MNAFAETLRRLYGPERGPFEPTHLWRPHRGLVHGIAVLPGGELFVSSSEDGTMHVISLHDGQVLHSLEGHSGPVNSLCLTPDGTRLITGGDDHTVRVWDTRSWEVEHVMAEHLAYVREVATSDTIAVSGAEDDTVRFWDLASGECLHVGEVHRENLRTVAISADGRRAASSGLDSQLILWDVARGEVERTLYDADATVIRPTGFNSLYIATGNHSGVGHRNAPRRLLFLGDGRTLVSTANDVIFWDLETGEETRRWPCWGWEHEAIALHPDGASLVLAGNGYVQIWDVAAGTLRTTLGRGGAHVTALAFTPDGRWLLTGTQEGAIEVWDFAAGLQSDDDCPHGHSITTLVTHGPRALTGDTGGGVVLWDLDAPGPLGVLDVEREANGRAMALGDDVALTAESGGFAVWDVKSGELRRRARYEDADALHTPHALVALADGRALIGHLGAGLTLWDLGEGGGPTPLTGDTRQISILAVSPDRRHAVSSGYFERPEELARANRKKNSGYVYVPSVSQLQGWDLETRALLWTASAGPDAGNSYVDFVFCLFTPDGRLVTRSGTNERELAFRNARTGDVVHTVALPGDYPGGARVAGRDLVLLVFDEELPGDGHACTAVRIDLATGEITHQRSLGRLQGMEASFTPDGSRVAVACLGALEVYDTDSGLQVARYECGPNIREMRFTDDGRRIVIGDQAGRVHVLELDGWQPTPADPWTPDELAALQRETEARTPAPKPAAKQPAVKTTKSDLKTKTPAKTKAGKKTATKATAKKAATKTTVKKAATKATAKKAATKATAKKAATKPTAKKSATKRIAKTTAKKTAAKKNTAAKTRR